MTKSRAVRHRSSRSDIVFYAAIRVVQTGRVLVGRHGEVHAVLWEMAAKKGLVGTNSAGDPWLDNIEDGFVTTSGKFLTREQAIDAALHAKQITRQDRRYIEAQNGGPGLEMVSFEERRKSSR